MASLLINAAADLLKALLPTLLSFLWEKAHEPTTVEDAKTDDARRARLLAAIRLQRNAGGNDPHNPATPAG
jgi:hypothetical protein